MKCARFLNPSALAPLSFPLGLAMAWLASAAAEAQVYPPCPPPATAEYLLLVRGQSASERERAMSLLPADRPVLVCDYLTDVVVRTGGFTSLEAVNSWSVYLNDMEGFDAFVVSPANATADSSPSGNRSYQPQSLGSGYAVLVDYSNQLEVARSVQQRLGKPVGLAVYRDRPYLLASHTLDSASAAQLLGQLTAAGFAAVLVDSQPVVRLVSGVSLDGAAAMP